MTEVQVTEGIDVGHTGDRRNTINVLALSFQLRKYEQACTQIDVLLQELSWSKTVAILREIPIKEDESFSYWHWNRVVLLSLCRGKFRDGLLNVLGLECVHGIDVDLLNAFGRFKAHSLQELREKVISKATGILKSQIQRKNTYFIDTAQLDGTTFECLVPEIKRQRAQEFSALGNNPGLSRAVTTYYGFAQLTSSLTAEDTIEIERISPTPIKFSGKRVSYQRSLFSHCSEKLTDLLLACLRLTFAQPQTQIKGANVLAELADSRSLGALHQVLKRENQSGWYADPLNPVKYRVIWALREIGHPSSFLHLKALVDDRTFDQHSMWAIARNRHPDAVEVLLERAFYKPVPYERNGLTSQYEATKMMWMSQDKRVVSPLVELMHDEHVREEALHSLMRLGDTGHRVIRENFPTVGQTVKDARLKQEIMKDLLRFIPTLLDMDDFIELLLDVVEEEQYLLSRVVDMRPEILQDPRLREPLLTVLKKSRNPGGLLCVLNEVGLLEDDAFRDAALGKVSKIAELVRVNGRRENIIGWTIDSIRSLPMLYNSTEVQSALAEVIEYGVQPRALLRRIEDHDVLGTCPFIHNAVIEHLAYEGWDIWFLEKVVKSQNLMQSEEVRNAVAKALATFWAIKKNARTAIRVDWDTSDYLWAYYLRPLGNYPEMGRIPEFQQAFARLLRKSDYPKGVISYIENFDGLLESEPVKKQTQRIAEEERREEERWRLSVRALSDEEIEEEKRRAQEEAYWDHYRSYY